MANVYTLTCRACGNRLEIPEGTETLACARCGREYQVRHSGGIVTLAPVDEEEGHPGDRAAGAAPGGPQADSTQWFPGPETPLPGETFWQVNRWFLAAVLGSLILSAILLALPYLFPGVRGFGFFICLPVLVGPMYRLFGLLKRARRGSGPL